MKLLGLRVKFAISRIPRYGEDELRIVIGEVEGIEKRLSTIDTNIKRIERKVYRDKNLDPSTTDEINDILSRGQSEGRRLI